MNIIGLPALVGSYDNYIWVLTQGQNAWVVDPGQAQPVLDYLSEKNLNLVAILVTHYHFDHTDGIQALKSAYPETIVYGPDQAPNPQIDIRLNEGDEIAIGNTSLKVLNTPGHTYDHISYYNNEFIFCGDTLFAAGCGRQFDGGYAAFAESILKIRQLPDHCAFYSAHEYTQSNLAFACYVDSDNTDLQERVTHFKSEYPTPMLSPQSTLGLEKRTNPFLRFDYEPIKSKLIARNANLTPESLFKTLRDWKDQIDKNGYPKAGHDVNV